MASKVGWARQARIAVAVIAVGALPGLPGCVLLPGPLQLSVTQQDLTPKVNPGGFKTVRIEISNSAAGTVRGITVRDEMPPGFSYLSTKAIAGDAIRTRTSDPAVNTPSPIWSSWSLPGGTPSAPAKLDLDFVVAVSSSPGKTPNFVQVATDDTDPLSAKPIVLTTQPSAILDLRVSARSPVRANGSTQYTIQLRNTGLAAARATVISAALPGGFLYTATLELGGNALRVQQTDPINLSVLPSWGTWDIPGTGEGGTAGDLRISFTVKVVGDVSPGNYPISVTVTYNNLPAQTVADQAQVTVIK